MPSTPARTMRRVVTDRLPRGGRAAQPGLDGEERRVVLELGVAGAGEVDRSRCRRSGPGRADSTTTRSEMKTDSAIEWVTNRTVVASGSHSRASRWRMSARVISSRAANGSSISSSGRAERHRPDEARRAAACRPTARAGRRRRTRPGRPRRAARRRRARASAWRARLTSSSRRAFSATVRHGSSAGDCGTNPMRLAARATCGLAPSTRDRPGGRFVEPADDAQQRGLAAAGRSEHGDDLAAGDVEVDRRQRLDGAERLGDARQRDASPTRRPSVPTAGCPGSGPGP